MKPFVGLKTEFTFSFIESSSTFGSRLGDQFKDGMTVIAQFENDELECSILFPPSENSWVADLTQDEKFTLSVTVIEFDNLYQRVVFGKSNQVESEPAEIDTAVLSTTNEALPKLPAAETQEKEEDPDEVQKKVEEVEVPPVIEGPPVLNSEITPKSGIEDGKLEAIPDIESQVEAGPPSPFDEKQKAKEESTVPGNLDQELTPALDEVGTDTPNTRQQDEQKITSPEQGQENSEGQTPAPLPQNTEDQEPVKKDHHYFEKLRNKRYEFGADSLTEKEKAALTEDLRINADSRKKELDKNQAFAKKAGRFFLGFVMISFSLNSCTQGNYTSSMLLLGTSMYLLFPYIKKILDEQA